MRPITSNCFTSAALAVALLLPVTTWAQTAAAPPTTPTAPAATSESPGAATQPAASPRKNVEERIADMHATLQITPAQDAKWDVFAQVMLDNAQGMDAALQKQAASLETQSAVQILQGYSDIAAQHARDVRKLSAAFKTVYAWLTPDQKKLADEMFRESSARHAQAKQGG
jgi:hypothetical protein